MISKFIKTVTLVLILFSAVFLQSLSAAENYITLTDITHNISSDGELVYTVKGKKGYLEKIDSNQFTLDKIQLLWFENKKVKMKITSDRGILDKKTGNIVMNGNVILTSEGKTMKCDYLNYDNKLKIIDFKGHVNISSDGMAVSAEKGKYDALTGIINLYDNVKGKIFEK